MRTSTRALSLSALLALAGVSLPASAEVPDRASTTRGFVRTVAGLAGRQLSEHDQRALSRAAVRGDRWSEVRKLARLSGGAAARYLLKRLQNEGNREPWATAASVIVGPSQPVAKGPPPLARGVLMALLQLYEFELKLRRADFDFELARAQRRKLARALVKAYAGMPPRQRRALAAVPARWLVLRAFWSQQSPERKRRFSARYRRELRAKQQARSRGGAKERARKRRRKGYDPDDEFVRHRLDMTSMDVLFDSMQGARNSTMSW